MKARVTGVVLIVAAAGAVAWFGYPSTEKPSEAKPVAKCGPECKCLPPCPCERGGECLQDEPDEVPQAKPALPTPCATCAGTGKVSTQLGPAICPHCPPKSATPKVCDGKNCRLCPVAPAKADELVSVQEPYYYSTGRFGRRTAIGYRTVQMKRSEYEARRAASQPSSSQFRGGGCRSCR